MSLYAAPAVDLMSAVGAHAPRRLQVVPEHGHDWRLRDVEFIDGFQARRFECDGCGAVNFR